MKWGRNFCYLAGVDEASILRRLFSIRDAHIHGLHFQESRCLVPNHSRYSVMRLESTYRSVFEPLDLSWSQLPGYHGSWEVTDMILSASILEEKARNRKAQRVVRRAIRNLEARRYLVILIRKLWWDPLPKIYWYDFIFINFDLGWNPASVRSKQRLLKLCG